MPETPDLGPIADDAFQSLVQILKFSDNRDRIIPQLLEIAKILEAPKDGK